MVLRKLGLLIIDQHSAYSPIAIPCLRGHVKMLILVEVIKQPVIQSYLPFGGMQKLLFLVGNVKMLVWALGIGDVELQVFQRASKI